MQDLNSEISELRVEISKLLPVAPKGSGIKAQVQGSEQVPSGLTGDQKE